MQRSRLLPWFFSAGLLIAAACSDSVGPTTTTGRVAPVAPAPPIMVTLTGSVHVSGQREYPAWLSTSDGQDIRLTGESANMLASVDNADVEVHGRWETDGADAFFVADFLVRAVDGNAVLDGTLISLSALIIDVDDGPRYAVQPTAGGPWIILSDPSADLLNHLNERIWVAGLESGSGAPTAYGVIKEM